MQVKSLRLHAGENPKPSKLEHMNLTVRNTDASASILAQLLDWQIRWAGAMDDPSRR